MVLGGKLVHDVEGAYRVGKMALKLLERFDDSTDLLPSVYLVYYGYIAVHIEPFQSCADMLKRGMCWTTIILCLAQLYANTFIMTSCHYFY